MTRSYSTKQRYKMLLEVLPLHTVIGLFLAFFLISALFMLFGAFGNDAYSTKLFTMEYDDNFEDVMKGNAVVQGHINQMNKLNTEMLFWMKLTPKSEVRAVTGFVMNLKLQIRVSATNDLYEPENKKQKVHALSDITVDRTLTCEQGSEDCNSVLLFHEPFIRYKTYVMEMKFLNQSDRASRAIFQPSIQFGVSYVDMSYALLEILYRYAFLILAALVAAVFFVYTRFRQQFDYWHTEQKWILFVLLFLILFNNPLFAVHLYTETLFFPLINIFFRVTFICILLLSMLVFTQSMYLKPEEKNVLSFYLPKIILVGGIWCVIATSYIYSELNKIQDPTYSFAVDFPYFRYILTAAATLISIYFIMLGYYILRAIGRMLDSPSKYSTKFKIVWGMTVAIICGTAMLFFLLLRAQYLNTAIILITFQVLFNAYPMILAVLFAPSMKKDTVDISQDVLTGRTEFTLDD